jgi:hypothetical protein
MVKSRWLRQAEDCDTQAQDAERLEKILAERIDAD